MKKIKSFSTILEKWKRRLVGFFLASANDMATGVIYAWVLLWVFDWPGSFSIYFFGAMVNILPDVDAIICRKKIHEEGEFYSEHRSWPHWPLIMIPLTIIVVFVCLSGTIFFTGYFLSEFSKVFLFFGILITVCELSHYLHDSVNFKENGTGIQWLAPFFSYDHFLVNLEFVVKIFIKRTKEEKVSLIKRIKKNTAMRLQARKEKIEDWLEEHYPAHSIQSFYGIFFLCFAIILVATV